jgi:hypothetical protein
VKASVISLPINQLLGNHGFCLQMKIATYGNQKHQERLTTEAQSQG